MASRSLGTLTIDILAKTGLLEQGLDQAGRSMRKFSRDVNSQAKDVEDAFDTAFKAVGVGAVAAFGAVSFAVKSAIEDMGQLVTQARQVAMPIDDFSAFAAVAKNAEVGTDTFTASLRKLSQTLVAAKQGNAQAAATFKAIGIDPAKVSTTKQAFLAISDSFAKYRDDTSKVAVAQQLLGKTGSEMIAFLDEGSAAIQKAADHQRDLGNALDENGAKKWQAYDDAVDEFQNTIDGLTKTLALDLLPAITDVTKQVTIFIQSWSDNGGLKTFTDALDTLLDHLEAIATFFAVRFVAAKVVGVFVAMTEAAKVAGTAIGILRVALAALGGPVGIVATAIAGLAAWYVQSSKGSTELANSTDQLRAAMQALHGLSGQAQADARAEAIENIKAALAVQQRVKAEIDRYNAMKALSDQTGGISIGPAGAGGGSIAAVTTGVDAKRVENLQKQYEASRVAVSDLLKEIEKPIRTAGEAAANATLPSITIPKIESGAKDTVDKLAAAYDALAKASLGYANSLTADDPLQKANTAMAEGVANLAKLSDAYVKAGGSAQTAQELFDKGLAGLKAKFTFDLGEPKRQLDAYTGSLDAQLVALKASNDAQLQGMTLGDHAAQQLQQLTSAQQEATKAITDFVQAHQLHPEAMSEDMYNKELAALKDYYAKRSELIQQNQEAENAIRSNMDAGWQKGIADFIEQTNNMFQQGQQLAQNFTSGFADAFSEFASGAESAKKAFGDFIDSLFAQALKFVANQALAKIFNAFGNSGSFGSSTGDVALGTSAVSSSGGGFWSSLLGAVFGGGRAGGGPVAAGGLYEVNERGAPEMLAIGGRQFLMMGPQSGTVQPATTSRGMGGTTNYITVQPTTTRRTADQIATAIDRKQRIATARNG